MFADLLSAVHSPTILAAELYSKHIIPYTLLDKMALTGLGDCEKSMLILKAVGSRLQTNPSDFVTVVTVFEESAAALLPEYAIRLREAYDKYGRWMIHTECVLYYRYVFTIFSPPHTDQPLTNAGVPSYQESPSLLPNIC